MNKRKKLPVHKDPPMVIIVLLQIGLTFLWEFKKTLHKVSGVPSQIHIHAVDKDFVTSRGVLILSNHQHRIDPFLVTYSLGFRNSLRTLPYRFPVAPEYMLRPFMGTMIWLLGGYDIGSTKVSLAHGLLLTQELLSRGQTVIMFPEGKIERNDATSTQNFQKGIFYLLANNTPLLLVRLNGLYKISLFPKSRKPIADMRLSAVLKTESMQEKHDYISAFYAPTDDLRTAFDVIKKYDHVPVSEDVDLASHILTENEARHYGAITSDHKRREFLYGRMVAKQAVQGYIGFSARPPILKDIEIKNTPSGKPFVVVGGDAEMNVSVSHSQGYVAASIWSPQKSSSGASIGIDIQKIMTPSETLLSSYLTDQELSSLKKTTLKRRRDTLATVLWSVKEAYLKAIGTGLSYSPKNIEVSLSGSQGTIYDSGSEARARADWCIIDEDFVFTKVLL